MLVGQKRISTALALGLLAAGLSASARAQAPCHETKIKRPPRPSPPHCGPVRPWPVIGSRFKPGVGW